MLADLVWSPGPSLPIPVITAFRLPYEWWRSGFPLSANANIAASLPAVSQSQRSEVNIGAGMTFVKFSFLFPSLSLSFPFPNCPGCRCLIICPSCLCSHRVPLLIAWKETVPFPRSRSLPTNSLFFFRPSCILLSSPFCTDKDFLQFSRKLPNLPRPTDLPFSHPRLSIPLHSRLHLVLSL